MARGASVKAGVSTRHLAAVNTLQVRELFVSNLIGGARGPNKAWLDPLPFRLPGPPSSAI